MSIRTKVVTVRRPEDVRLTPYPGNLPHLREPYAVGKVITHLTDVPILATDRDEGVRRSMPSTEGVYASVFQVGPGGGEEWHTHLSYYDVFFYVVNGKGQIAWKDGGVEKSEEFSKGCFIYIAPQATHKWINTGSDDLTLIGFVHSHDYQRSPHGADR